MSAPDIENVKQSIWKPLVVAAAIAFVYANVLAKLGRDWWDDPNYSHGLLIPFIAAYILWIERDQLERLPKRSSIAWGGLGVGGALLLLWVGTAGSELFVQRMSLVLMLTGVVLYFWGKWILRFSLVPLLLLVLAIPIPTIVLNKIAFPLQLFASRCAVWAMRMFDIPVLREGNVIELMPFGATQTKKLEVVEACSGIRSLMTLVTLAVVFAYFTYPVAKKGNQQKVGNSENGLLRRFTEFGVWRSVIIVLSAIPIAIITNAMRVSGTGVLSRYYGTEIADGFFHSFSGWIIYIVAFLMLFAVGWLVDRAAKLSGRQSGGSSSSGQGGTTAAAAAVPPLGSSPPQYTPEPGAANFGSVAPTVLPAKGIE